MAVWEPLIGYGIMKPGETLGHYRIRKLLGVGGMGEVYLALDTKLNRPVALKVLRKEFLSDPERHRRFIHEARAASALDHPNIVTIYDISEQDGVNFIVMQYVDGESLGGLIRAASAMATASQGLELDKVLDIAIQMAEGLGRAHREGIVHRDLKPDNVMVDEEGRAKIVDFGLAKLTEPPPGEAPTGEGPTVDQRGPLTREGEILGTGAYMSPEQAQGDKIDARSDLFSFGSVLYEMVTGEQAFSGESIASVLASILRDEPKQVSQLVPAVPVELEAVIEKALRKDREERFQSMDELREALVHVRERRARKPAHSRIVRLGEFEADLEAGELWKQGRKIKIQGKPFEILSILLERPGRVVSREELFKRLWSSDTFVDFDNSVNAAINKLRSALGDSADQPRFIETVPRRGYRFVGPIQLAEIFESAAIQPVAPPARPEVGEVRQQEFVKKPRLVFIAGILLLAGLLVGAGLWVKSRRARWAQTVALPEATRLLDEGKTYAAFRWLRQAEAYVPDDLLLQQMLLESTTPVTIRTTPEGAQVSIRDFFDEPDAWEFLGTAPLEGLRLPTGFVAWKISLEGFQTRELLGFTPDRIFDFSLQPAKEAPPGMVHVPGVAEMLDEFWIDQYEVTNAQFKDFVDRGGYDKREYWKEPFVKDGQAMSWEEARQVFRDRTGRAGPAIWEVGSYPDGQADYPVGGISWYEAAAYCASVGKELPTFYHWNQAANLILFGQFATFSHFAADGPAKVGHPLRLGVLGTYDMAGNIKEWCRNEADAGRRYILGGGWNEPSYQFLNSDAQRPWDREPTYGVRCVQYSAALPASQTEPITEPFRDWRRETPVDDEVFEVYESLYQYDSIPLEPSVDSEPDELKDWSVEHLSYAAAYGNERVPSRLFLPNNAPPPYQTVVFFPGGGAWFQPFSAEGTVGDLFLVRSGRAVLFPVYKGMYERHVEDFSLPNIWRDMIIQSAKDLRRAVDYLETRPDIDAEKLAYYGVSAGGWLGPIMTAVEPRFKASILIGGGLFGEPRPPESAPLHFLPRVKVPTLMINGRHDFALPLETSQVPMFELLGTPPADKRHRVFDSGHYPSERQEVMKEVLDWLDRYLGPVSRR